MTTVNVTVEFLVGDGADFEAEQQRVLDELFDLESKAGGVSDAGQVCDSQRRFVALSVYAKGQNVDQATASALAAIIGAVEKVSASWTWQATHVTPADTTNDASSQLLTA